ncbi:MAG: hypothetical protein AAB150_12750 [Pseudomonadota bacterium]
MIKPLKLAAFAIGAAAAFSCQADVFVREDIITEPDPAQFNICFDHGCASLAWVKLSTEQWQRVRSVFALSADSAAKEREQIRSAVALLETIVGAMTGTSTDKGGNWAGWGLPGQMDCIDESTNTTIYLRMLQKDGLLRWHQAGDRATRWTPFTWPHTTAVIEERDSLLRWAVDSWFLDNGEPPFALPLPTWRDGWKPDNKGSSGSVSAPAVTSR